MSDMDVAVGGGQYVAPLGQGAKQAGFFGSGSVETVGFARGAVIDAMRQIDEVAQRGASQWGRVPALSASSVGPGFAAIGARLERAASELCLHCTDMYAGLAAHSVAVGQQWEGFFDAEAANTAALRGAEVSPK